MNFKENKKRFDSTEIMAVNIGPYANYRHKVLTVSFTDLFDRMYETGRLREHLEDMQFVMESYMNEYTQIVLASDEYKKMSLKEGYSKAFSVIAKPRIDAEENRMGNRWVCAKNPYNDELFMEWLAAASICKMLTEE